MVRRQHAAGSPAQDCAADVHQYRELIHDLDDDGAAEDDNRHGYEHAEDEQSPVIACDADNPQHVVQAHERIGQNNRTDCSPQRILRFDFYVFLFVACSNELDADADEQYAADRL